MSQADDDILERIRRNFEIYNNDWLPVRKEADEDMRNVAGSPWSDEDVRLRKEAMRPIQTTDELHQFFNQVINDVRMNPRSVKFDPTGTGTNDDRATFYTDKWREIEYRSNAPRHYITALENCIYRSFGWVRVNTRLASARSKNLELWVEAVPNPNMILPDPDALEPDSSDAKGLFAYHLMGIEEFKRRFQDAKVQDFPDDMRKAYPTWVKDSQRIQLAEYWEVTTKSRDLMILRRDAALKLLKPSILQDQTHEAHAQLQSGMHVGAFDGELIGTPSEDDLVDVIPVEDRKVTQYLTNGMELLETKPWPGKYIPFASCFGKVLYLDKGGEVQRQILSMTRLARNPYMALCYLATCELELIGMMPKFPYFFAKGSLSNTQLQLLKQSLHEPVAGIEYDPYPDGVGTQQVPPPMRQPYEPPLQPIEIAKEAARRSIQAAMGITPLPTPAQRNNEKSGSALQRIESSGQKGSYHFIDNFDAMIRHVGIIGEDLMTPIYDTMRTTGVRDALGRASQIVINNPANPDGITTKGNYLVTVSSGPSFESARDASQSFIQSLMQSPILQQLGPQISSKVLALGLRLQNLGHVVDGVADLVDPPQDKKMTPEMMQGQLQHAQQQLQQAGQMVQKLQFEQQADAQKVKGSLMEKQLETQNALTLKKMDDATKIAVALISAKTKTDIEQTSSQLEVLATGIQAAHEERMAAKDHAQAGAQDAAQHAHEIKQALLDHATTMQQAQQEHDHNVQAIVTQAAVTPEPEQPAASQ